MGIRGRDILIVGVVRAFFYLQSELSLYRAKLDSQWYFRSDATEGLTAFWQIGRMGVLARITESVSSSLSWIYDITAILSAENPISTRALAAVSVERRP